MTDEQTGAWNPHEDPSPEPGAPPRNLAVVRQPSPAPQTGGPRDPNAPPEGTQTVKSFGGGAMPERHYPKRCIWLTLPFYGFHVYAWVNAPDQLLTDIQKNLRGVRSPDDPRIDPDDPNIDPFDFALDVEEYGISEVERQARVNERDRREREIARRRQEKTKRQHAYDVAKADVARFLGEIVMEHDIPDLNGALLPADSSAFWDFAEGELQSTIMTTITGQRGKLSPTNARR
jgi:hypothetical protein